MAIQPSRSYFDDRTGPPSAISHSQDLTIPLSLLQATGNIGSVRDREGSLTWQPQPILPDGDGYTADLVARRGTHASCASELAGQVLNPIDEAHPDTLQYDDLSPGSELQARVRHPRSRKVSRMSRDSPRRSRSRNMQWSQQTVQGLQDYAPAMDGASARSNTSTVWSTADPFIVSNKRVGIDANHSATLPTRHKMSTTSRPQAFESRDAGRPSASKPRRGTLRSIVESVVPNIARRRYTNVSYTRKSSLWQVYEKAKVRGVKLQRTRFAQVAFEYAVYIVLLSIVYFVLVGVPLWKGTVYWLWWLVAHKFVIAGGFSITLGIALL